MRQRLFPCTAGAAQGFPERVFAPQRGLWCIGLMVKERSDVILFHQLHLAP